MGMKTKELVLHFIFCSFLGNRYTSHYVVRTVDAEKFYGKHESQFESFSSKFPRKRKSLFEFSTSLKLHYVDQHTAVISLNLFSITQNSEKQTLLINFSENIHN